MSQWCIDTPWTLDLSRCKAIDRTEVKFDADWRNFFRRKRCRRRRRRSVAQQVLLKCQNSSEIILVINERVRAEANRGEADLVSIYLYWSSIFSFSQCFKWKKANFYYSKAKSDVLYYTALPKVTPFTPGLASSSRQVSSIFKLAVANEAANWPALLSY